MVLNGLSLTTGTKIKSKLNLASFIGISMRMMTKHFYLVCLFLLTENELKISERSEHLSINSGM